MKFGFEQSWQAEVGDIIALYLDPGFWDSLHDLSRTGAPEVLGIDRDGDTALVQLRYRFTAELPSEVSRFVDPGNVSWVERTAWNLAAGTAEVQFLPNQGSALMRASAGVTLTQQGAEVVRQVRGDLSVRVPLVGRRVEKVVVEGIGEHLEEEAEEVATRVEG